MIREPKSPAIAEVVSIDYEALAAGYARRLTSVLRNFKSSGHRFLETWVPEQDALRSILGILEAAQDNAVPRISVHIGSATLSRVDLPELKRQAGRFGNITLETRDQGIMLDVALSGAAVDRLVADVVPPAEPVAPPRLSRAVATPFARPADAPVPRRGQSNPIYAAGLRRAAASPVHERGPASAERLVAVQASRDGVTLSVLVDPGCHFVRQASYSGVSGAEARGLFETLCRLLENRPILECRDHAAIRLEHELRDHSLPRPVPGILMPENADPMFALPARLVRDLFAAYCQKTGLAESNNQYDPPVSDRWNALSLEQRIGWLQEAADCHLAGQGVTILRMDSPKRVVLAVKKEASASASPSQLMALEDHLQRSVEPTLQVSVEPKVDQSRFRRPKEASTA
jgi:hypothetical protein